MKTPRVQREQIVEAALALLEQDGLDGLSMRKLAQTLDMQAASLYWHFASKQALVDAMADNLIGDVARTLQGHHAWDEGVRMVAREFRQALLKHRDGARVFAGTYVVTDNVLRTNEALISGFGQAGADPDTAAQLTLSLTYFVLGLVMEEQALGPGSTADLGARNQAFMKLALAQYPGNWAARNAISSVDFNERFEMGLALLIAGVEPFLKLRKKAK
ncbi:TetR/AcrR family transcriptional regulator C-terminal domain-containing protein [Comamonas sp. MYb21]|uniref:TetR/AcrR family transcriptional regulator C-terminal domain-containing protein n=1 Tax=Comamonas sp. MYb21 TaxID=1848648 RepID=UPI0030ADC954